MSTTAPARVISIALALCALAPAASAERELETTPSTRPQAMYIRVPAAPNTGTSNAVSSRLVFLHRCQQGGGCPVKFGTVDDSRTDTSSIVSGQRIIGEFTQSDEVWKATVECVKTTFAPFNIQITDQDPGSNTPHFENIVGGKPTDLGRSDLQNAGGVAPFTCGEVPNAIVYTFDVYGADAEQLCWTSAQEVAHAFGLDHEFLQKDPMTYIQGDLPKRFRDQSSECGELDARSCGCPNRPKQNSYRMIVGLFGPGAPTPPEVTFNSPSDGKEIQPGFRAVIKAVDEVRVVKVALRRRHAHRNVDHRGQRQVLHHGPDRSRDGRARARGASDRRARRRGDDDDQRDARPAVHGREGLHWRRRLCRRRLPAWSRSAGRPRRSMPARYRVPLAALHRRWRDVQVLHRDLQPGEQGQLPERVRVPRIG
jgi:hypothetical protein